MAEIRQYRREKQKMEIADSADYEIDLNNGGDADQKHYEKKLRRHRARVYRFMILLAVVIVAVIFIVSFVKKKNSFQEFKVESSIRRTDTGTAQYLYIGSNLYRCSKDGVSAMDSSGQPVWNAVYQVNSPVIASGGSYFAVADLNGYNVYLFNENGALGSITSAMPVLQISVASAGYIAVVVEDNGADYINMYEMGGDRNKIYTIKKSISIDGLPLCISISPDGEKLVCAYVGVKEGKIQSNLVFSNFNEVGQNENERIVGGYNYEEELIGKVVFLNETIVAVFGETSLDFYRIKEYPDLIASVELDYEIQEIFYSGSYVGLIHPEPESGEKTLSVYNTSGALLTELPIDNAGMENDAGFTYRFAGDSVLMYGDKSCKLYDLSGRELFSYTFDDAIVDLFPINGNREYIYINSNFIEKIKLK